MHASSSATTLRPDSAAPAAVRPADLAVAVAIPFLACAVQWALWEHIRPYVWFLFFPAAFFSAWIGGLFGGLAATLLSALLVWYFFIPPALSFELKDLSAAFSVVVFTLMGSLFALFHERLRRAARRADEARRAAEAANNELGRLYEKSLELDAQKSQFFANVSHELRTPLTLLLAPLEKRLRQAELPAAERRETEMMLRNARLLYRHVTDLLDAAKLDAGAMTVNWSRLDLVKLLRTMASHFESVAAERHIDFGVSVPDALSVEADGEKLQRVVVNLLSNAFKFTPDGGRIALRLGQAGHQASIEVQDNGPGVPPGLRSAVFERFRQGDGDAQRRHGGTGLGLAIAKDFVDLHGGTLSVSEAAGGGALFSVTLPLQAPPGSQLWPAQDLDETIDRQAIEELAVRAPAPAASPPNDSTDSRPLVLIVEDNPDMNELIATTLRPHYRVAQAADGRQGLERALALKPDLIVSDLMMPGLSGDQMVGELRRQAVSRDLPVIMLTARADDETRLRLLRTGAQECLSKPFSTEELLTRADNLLASRQRSVEELERSAGRLRRLAESVEKIAGTHDLASLMAIVRRAMRELTGADGVTLVLRDDDHCHYVDEDAIGPLWKGQRFPLDQCVSGWAMLHGEAVVIEDIYVDPRIPYAAYRPTFVKSLSMVPVGRSTPVGAIGCYWASRHRASAEELELQQAMADALSVGLANLELYKGMAQALHAAEQAAAAARASEERFRRLFHEAPVPLCSVGQDGTINDLNARFEQMFGYRHAELPSLDSWWPLACPDPDYLQWITTTWKAAVAEAAGIGGDIRPTECRIRCRNGTVRTMLLSGITLGDDILATFFDLTEHKAAEETLRTHTEELQRRNDELERFNRAATGREIEMIKLKQQINDLSRRAGMAAPYPLEFLDAGAPLDGGRPDD